jgi:hypothetical protein
VASFETRHSSNRDEPVDDRATIELDSNGVQHVNGEGLKSALDCLEGMGALKVGHAGLNFCEGQHLGDRVGISHSVDVEEQGEFDFYGAPLKDDGSRRLLEGEESL